MNITNVCTSLLCTTSLLLNKFLYCSQHFLPNLIARLMWTQYTLFFKEAARDHFITTDLYLLHLVWRSCYPNLSYIKFRSLIGFRLEPRGSEWIHDVEWTIKMLYRFHIVCFGLQCTFEHSDANHFHSSLFSNVNKNCMRALRMFCSAFN
jgi:hypothetical protein